MFMWQPDNVGADGGALQPLRELLGSFLPGLIVVLVEGNVDGTAWLICKLSQLSRRKLRADRAGGVPETGLPQYGKVKQSFHENHGWRKC